MSDLVNDALGLLAGPCGDDAPQREGKEADALGWLALVAGQAAMAPMGGGASPARSPMIG